MITLKQYQEAKRIINTYESKVKITCGEFSKMIPRKCSIIPGKSTIRLCNHLWQIENLFINEVDKECFLSMKNCGIAT
jgi:hypothetical protein